MIELTTFRLIENADEARFLADDAAVQTAFANLEPGMLRRTTARGEEGEWLVATLWSSASEADGATTAEEKSAEVQAMHAWIDLSSMVVRRYESLD